MNEKLLRYIHNELTREERREVEAQLRADAAFAKEHEDAKNFDAQLKDIFEGAFEELKERLPAKDFMGAAAKKKARRGKTKVYLFANYISAAAMLAASLIFMAAVLIKPANNTEINMGGAAGAEELAALKFEGRLDATLARPAQSVLAEAYAANATVLARAAHYSGEMPENEAAPLADAGAVMAKNKIAARSLAPASAPMILPAEIHAEIARKSKAEAKLYIAKVVNSKPITFRPFIAKKNYDAYFKNLNENTIFEDDTLLSFAPNL